MAALHVRLASAFRWRLPSAAAERDVVRLRADRGAHVMAVANAYDSGFSTCWLPGSRLILDRFEEAWAAGSGPVVGRLHAAFAVARAAFAAEAPGLEVGDDDGPPAATLHVVALDGAAAHAVWIGGEVTVVARGFEIAAATAPHTLAERFHAEGRGAPPPKLAHVVTRTIGAAGDAQPPSMASIALAPGDTVIVAGRVRPPAGELAVAAGGFLAPAALAERTVAAVDQRPFAVAAVARVDAIDVAAAIEALVDRYVPGPRRDPWLGDWARAQRALPVWSDMGGVLAIRGDGTVVAVDRDQARTRIETDPTWHRVVTMAAARHPALAALAPTRPPGAAACRVCALYPALAGAGCPGCQGLGWELPPLPAWLRPAPTGRTG